MPVTVKFDPNSLNVQSSTIQNATSNSDGAMSKEQARQLAGVTADTSALVSPSTSRVRSTARSQRR